MNRADELLTLVMREFDRRHLPGISVVLISDIRAYLNERCNRDRNPDSVHFSVERADGSATDYGLKP